MEHETNPTQLALSGRNEIFLNSKLYQFDIWYEHFILTEPGLYQLDRKIM